MEGKYLTIRSLERFPKGGPWDEIELGAGLNVFSGAPNTGKTKWLRTIDFLFGDTDPASDTLGELAEKYDSALCKLEIGSQLFTLERKWKERGLASKVIINGNLIDANQISDFLLPKLGLPLVEFPQGNPLTGKWKPITWRMLLRHVFRREAFWEDFADQQPPSEQHACLMAFLGIAEHLFPKERSDLAAKEREILRLQMKKEQFEDTLNQVAKELLAAEEMGVAVTEPSIDNAVLRLRARIDELGMERDAILEAVRADESLSEAAPGTNILVLSEDWSDHKVEREEIATALSSVRKRLSDLMLYQRTLEMETDRLKRAVAAGTVMADIKVNQCPVCDRPVEAPIENHCILCRRPDDVNLSLGISKSVSRVELELQQLKEEQNEISELISMLRTEESANQMALREIDDKIADIEERLRPVRKAAAAIMPPEIAHIDQEIGRIAEQTRQWERVKSALDVQKKLTFEISHIETEASQLESEIAQYEKDINFEECADALSSWMNTYLNELNVTRPDRWARDARVSVRLREKAFDVKINKLPWSSALGGTWKGYLLLAYHYALLALSPRYFYPGLVILDYPKSFEESRHPGDSANYTLEPFLNLLTRPEMSGLQIIAAGKAFEEFENANIVSFNHVWI